MEFIPGSEQLFDITRGRYRCILSLLLKREVVWNLELLALFTKDCVLKIVWGSKLHFVFRKRNSNQGSNQGFNFANTLWIVKYVLQICCVDIIVLDSIYIIFYKPFLLLDLNGLTKGSSLMLSSGLSSNCSILLYFCALSYKSFLFFFIVTVIVVLYNTSKLLLWIVFFVSFFIMLFINRFLGRAILIIPFLSSSISFLYS